MLLHAAPNHAAVGSICSIKLFAASDVITGAMAWILVAGQPQAALALSRVGSGVRSKSN